MKRKKQKPKNIFTRVTSLFLMLAMMLSMTSPMGMMEVEAADQLISPGAFEWWTDNTMPGNNTGMSASSGTLEHITLTESDRGKFLPDPRHYHGFAADRAESFFPTDSSGSIEVIYNGVIETSDRRPVALKLTVSNFLRTQPCVGGAEEPIPFISFSENIKEGHISNGFSSFDIHAEFFYEDTGAKYSGTGMYFYYGSLNLGEGVVVDPSNVVNTKRLTSTNVQYDSTMGWEGMNDNFEDYLDKSTFNNNSIVIETNSAELNYTVYTRSLKYTNGRGMLDPEDELPNPDFVQEWTGYNSDLWCAISFSPMAATAPLPEKDMKVGSGNWSTNYDGVKLGEELTYRVKQKVQTLGYNGAYKYDSFVFSDKLPSEVDYTSATICKDGTDIGSGNYSISYDKGSHTVTGTINPSYLASGMDYVGETYQLVIKTKVNASAFNTGAVFENKASTTINGDKADTNVTKTKPLMPALSIVKTVNGKKYEEYKVGEKVPYKLVVKNTVAGTIAKGVVVKDHSLPSDMVIDASSVKVDGISGAKASVTNNKLTVNVGDLKSEIVTITFNAVANKALNGKETVNTASVTATNVPDEPKDNGKVYTNSPEIALTKEVKKYEYQVGEDVQYVLRGRQTVNGATAKDVVISDKSLPKDMTIDPASVQVSGQAKVVLNGQTIDNKPTVKVEGSTISVSWPYLQNEEVVVSFTAKASSSENGKEIINTAVMSSSNVDKNNIEAKAKIWINTPKLVLDKRADRESKKYKVNDLVTYTIDLTNKQTGTIARNIVIKDEIKTAGVKLQKKSIVFTDSKGKIIEPVSLEITGNTFVAVLGKDSVNKDNYSVYDNGKTTEQSKQNPEGKKTETLITCEYQMIITDEKLAGQTIENVATASSDNTPDEKDDEVVIVPKDEMIPGLSIVKTADKAAYNVGDTFYYQLDVTNKVPNTTAENVVIEDEFQTEGADVDQESLKITLNSKAFEPKSITFSEDGKSFKIETGKDLTSEDRIKVRYKGKFNDAALLEADGVLNIAKASAKDIPPVSDDNVVVMQQQTGLLNIDKEAAKESYYVGETGKYTITVTNTIADSIVREVVIDDLMKTKGMVNHPETIKMFFNDQEVKFDESMLEAQKDKSFKLVTGLNVTDKDRLVITYDVTYTEASPTGQAENIATARGDKVPPVTDEEIVPLITPELVIEKSADKEKYFLGDIAEYTLKVTNKYEDSETLNVVITDKLMTKGTKIDVDSFHLSYKGQEVKLTDKMLTVKDGTFTIKTGLNLKEKEEILVTYKVKFTEEIKDETVVNKATAKGDNTPETETDKEVPVVVPKLQIVKTSDKEKYSVGETAKYTLTVTNIVADTTAKEIVVADNIITKGVELDKESITLLYNDEPVKITKDMLSVKGNVFTIKTGYDITNKDTIKVTYKVKFTEAVKDESVVNKATATSNNTPETETEKEVPLTKPELALEKSADKEFYNVGDTGKYTLLVTNKKAGSVAKNVVIEDAIQTKGSNIKFDSVKLFLNDKEVEIKDKMLEKQEDGFILNTGKDLTSEDTIKVTYDVEFKEVSKDKEVINKALAKADDVPPVEAEHKVPFTDQELIVTKISDKKSYKVGETGKYKIEVKNVLEGSVAKQVVVTDTMQTDRVTIQSNTITMQLNGKEIKVEGDMLKSQGNTFTINTKQDLKSGDILTINYDAKMEKAISKAINAVEAKGENTKTASANNTVEVVSETAAKTTTNSSTISGVKTGDEGTIANIIVIIVGLSLLSLVVVMSKKKKKH